MASMRSPTTTKRDITSRVRALYSSFVMHIYMYHTFLGRSKLGQSKTLPGQTEKVLGWRIRAKSPIDEEEMGDWSLEKGEMLEKKKGRRGKKKGVGLKTNGLGFGPTLTWPSPRGLDSKLNPESRIDPIPRFRDSWPDSPAILRSRLNPLNRSRIPPPNRRIKKDKVKPIYERELQSMLEGLDEEGREEDVAVGGPSEKFGGCRQEPYQSSLL
ncbi:hypothetical protein CRG98_042239 [Punica granatum]|uniref:Uncharacterized protein n=1 Tax=Punica granatum TaxID=22663 RepID=A0A2I0I085_PUNGR|nr:hypothetical protein CRG98_042239 [Punica granatum]